MAGSTSNILTRLQARVPTSSSAHRNIQRGNAGLAVTQLTVQSGLEITNTTSPIPLIPIAFTQFLNSGYAVLREDTHLNEKVIQGLQALFSAVILGFAISLIFNDQEVIRQVMYLFQLLYSSLLLISWGGSEMSRDSSTNSATTEGAAHRLKSLIKRAVDPDEDLEKAEKKDEEEEYDETEENNLEQIRISKT
ncbi:hypothetical protein OQJ18_14255 [Fluoribacter dumoffii]|uniref:Uncharacterized protein n=1 Tax=Fluoribacter dumoffii TaxID=463 RepID=A0A377GDK1_9GAMM|nr:hypothetical protein [Fluoribacter dumoffii]KTC91129.1 hypothetical protein Ldum_2197 [Fluoribacter dumoffii NY 23]MCW8416738.1 hypothetical protein [Fluoribacter dumoffii]MCW8455422.1 hypothetical protein [Fluoribacter dumoffii]MCW8460500.1 hypothetical protein [Fluoribacter dumoffii]MCW8483981.1 hypothetical protein [Fluoribacter dumoffii]